MSEINKLFFALTLMLPSPRAQELLGQPPGANSVTSVQAQNFIPALSSESIQLAAKERGLSDVSDVEGLIPESIDWDLHCDVWDHMHAHHGGSHCCCDSGYTWDSYARVCQYEKSSDSIPESNNWLTCFHTNIHECNGGSHCCCDCGTTWNPSTQRCEEEEASSVLTQTCNAEKTHTSVDVCNTTADPECAALIADMASIANAIYDSSSNTLVNGWSLGEACDYSAMDFVGVYSKNEECVVAFSGTNNLADWETNLLGSTQTVSHPECNLHGVHEGFYQEFSTLLRSQCWQDVINPFVDANCHGKVYSTGHSLGGAIASVFATCLNGGATLTDSDDDIHLPQHTVAGLFTFGAPVTAREPLTDCAAKDGHFQGARVYIEDVFDFDPIPYVSDTLGLKHPSLRAIRFNGLAAQEHPAGSEESWGEPNSVKFPDSGAHGIDEYIRRVQSAYSVNTEAPTPEATPNPTLAPTPAPTKGGKGRSEGKLRR